MHNNELKSKVHERTLAVESLLGVLDLNLLKSRLEERYGLLVKLVACSGSDPRLLPFLSKVLSRDAVIRARLSIMADSVKQKLTNIEAECNAAKKYARSAVGSVDGTV